MNYHDAIAKLRDHGRLTGAQLRYNVAKGLPLLTDLQPCFEQLREWLHGAGVEGRLLRNWKDLDQLDRLVRTLCPDTSYEHVAMLDPAAGCCDVMFWKLLQFQQTDNVLSMVVTIDTADAADDLPGDIVTAGLLLHALAPVVKLRPGELVLNVGLLTLSHAPPVASREIVPLTIVPPGGGLEGLLSLEWEHVSTGLVAA